MSPLEPLSAVAVALDIRRPGTFVPRVRRVDPGFEIDGLLNQTRCNVRVGDGMCEFQKRYCLLRQVLFAHHYSCLRLPLLPAPEALRCSTEFVPNLRYKVKH
jgi:hypothetical protein